MKKLQAVQRMRKRGYAVLIAASTTFLAAFVWVVYAFAANANATVPIALCGFCIALFSAGLTTLNEADKLDASK